MTAERLYSKTIDSGIHKSHGRDDILSTDADDRAAKTLQDAYRPGKHPLSVDATSLTSKASWPLLSPSTFPSLYATRQILRTCYDQDCWEAASKAWLCTLVRQGTVLCVDSSRYCISLGDIANVCLLCWPLEHYDTPSGRYFTLGEEKAAASANFIWLPCLSFANIRVVPTRVCSPLRLFISTGYKLQSFAGVVLQATSPAADVFVYAATCAFWKLPLTTIKRVCLEVDCGFVDGDSEVQILHSLLKHLLPKMDAASLAQIMRLRTVTAANELPEVFTTDAVDGVFEKDDMVDIQDRSWSLKLSFCVPLFMALAVFRLAQAPVLYHFGSSSRCVLLAQQSHGKNVWGWFFFGNAVLIRLVALSKLSCPNLANAFGV